MSEPSAFPPVPMEHFVFRLIAPDSVYFPPGAKLPLPEWLVPTKSDVKAAELRGRPAGLSGFDRDLCDVARARDLLGRRDDLAFGAKVQEFKSIGARYERTIEVVYSPMASRKPTPGWDAHVLVEGLRRPDSTPRKAQLDLLNELVSAMQMA